MGFQGLRVRVSLSRVTAWLEVWRSWGSGLRGLGFRVEGFWGLGFRGLGVQG